MDKEKIIPIVLGSSGKIRFYLNVDESLARKLVEEIDNGIEDFTPSESAIVVRVLFSGDGWDAELRMNSKIAKEVRDSVEEKLLSEITLPDGFFVLPKNARNTAAKRWWQKLWYLITSLI